jgi:MYXO-CTERM domain-containing protein
MVAVVRDRVESPCIRRCPMKFSALCFTLATVVAGSLAWTAPARAAGTTCVNDIDCKANGIACGTDVCDYTKGATCGPAGLSTKGSDGWCDPSHGDADCKCKSLGAKCMGVYCTFTTPPAGGSGSGSGSATSGTATSGSATSGSTTSGTAAGSGSAAGGAPAGGGKSSSCSVGAVGSSSSWAAAAMALGAFFAASRRRRR